MVRAERNHCKNTQGRLKNMPWKRNLLDWKVHGGGFLFRFGPEREQGILIAVVVKNIQHESLPGMFMMFKSQF